MAYIFNDFPIITTGNINGILHLVRVYGYVFLNYTQKDEAKWSIQH